MSSELTGKNGTRFQPPDPLNVLPARVIPGKIAFGDVDTELTVALTGWAEAKVVMVDSCQPLIKYLTNAELPRSSRGCQTQLMTARCRWSSVELPLSNR